MDQLFIAAALEAYYQKDVPQSWGWERLDRSEWSEDMLPYPRLIGRNAHAAIVAYYSEE